ncbi:MAG: two-component regulator propeller domain-containing protein, partial [Bacteroidota bacterium]
MGTSGLGVTRYDGQQFVTYQQDSGFVHLKVKAIFEDCDGLLWFGTEGGGIVRYDGTRFTQYRGSRIGDQGLSDSWVRGIEQDRNDNLWVATAGRGIT